MIIPDYPVNSLSSFDAMRRAERTKLQDIILLREQRVSICLDARDQWGRSQ